MSKITGSMYWLAATAFIAAAIFMDGSLIYALYFTGAMVGALGMARGYLTLRQ